MTRTHHRPRRRIVLYSHDTVGLGHLRRNLAIAAVLVERLAGGADVLVISGNHGVETFRTPRGIDFLTLPGIAKRDRTYAARSLGFSLDDVVALRSAIIRSAVVEFDPDLLIVDKVAQGVDGELDATLAALSERGRARCVLGLRDILDDADTTVSEWASTDTDSVVHDHYDAVWWYGDPTVFDSISQYRLNGSVAARSQFTGYLARHRPSADSGLADDVTACPFALCMVGGGEDGFALAHAFANAPVPGGLRRLIVAGPFMSARDRAALEGQPDVTVVEVVPDCADLIARAESVVSMGGYNSVCELLAAGVRPLIVPRVAPRLEQLVRAERLAPLGLVDLLHPDDLSPDSVGAWLGRSSLDRRPSTHPVDLDGLLRIPDLVDDLLHDTQPDLDHQHPAMLDVVAPPREQYRATA